MKNNNWIPAFAGMTITGRFEIRHSSESWNPVIIKWSKL